MSFFQYALEEPGAGYNYKFIQKNKRICNDRNYNNYFYINKVLEVEGTGDNSCTYELTEEDFNVNVFRMLDNKDNESSMEFLCFLDWFEKHFVPN